MVRKLAGAAALSLGLTLAWGAPHWSDGATLPASSQSSMTVEQPVAQVHAAVLRALSAMTPDQEQYRRYRLVIPFGSPLFPSDADLAAYPNPAGQPGLDQWLRLPAVARRNDVLIIPDVDYYWQARRTEFTTEFIVHLQPLAASSTAVLVLQLHSKVRLGKKFDLLGRTGPGFYWDIRPAPPSPQASATLLEFLAAALARPSQ